jgi:hypothetical protein
VKCSQSVREEYGCNLAGSVVSSAGDYLVVAGRQFSSSAAWSGDSSTHVDGLDVTAQTRRLALVGCVDDAPPKCYVSWRYGFFVKFLSFPFPFDLIVLQTWSAASGLLSSCHCIGYGEQIYDPFRNLTLRSPVPHHPSSVKLDHYPAFQRQCFLL